MYFKIIKQEGFPQIHPLLIPDGYSSKIISVLKQFVREWSTAGQKERDIAFQPIIDSVQKHFKQSIKSNGKKVKILFPDQFEEFLIPDVVPTEYVGNNQSISLIGGNFIDVYKNQLEQWDCVVTCFFIDTAHNILDYIQTIYNILPQNGIWVNFGPLLYHYAEINSECSIELSWEEVKFAIEKFNFKIEEEKYVESTYTQRSDALMLTVYKCIFFKAIKL